MTLTFEHLSELLWLNQAYRVLSNLGPETLTALSPYLVAIIYATLVLIALPAWWMMMDHKRFYLPFRWLGVLVVLASLGSLSAIGVHHRDAQALMRDQVARAKLYRRAKIQVRKRLEREALRDSAYGRRSRRTLRRKE